MWEGGGGRERVRHIKTEHRDWKTRHWSMRKKLSSYNTWLSMERKKHELAYPEAWLCKNYYFPILTLPFISTHKACHYACGSVKTPRAQKVSFMSQYENRSRLIHSYLFGSEQIHCVLSISVLSISKGKKQGRVHYLRVKSPGSETAVCW